MHLVFITSIVPDGAPATGYELANDAVISALRRAGVRLSIVGFSWPGKKPSHPEDTHILGEIDVRNENAGSFQKAAWVANAIRLGLPVTCAKLRVIEPAELVTTLNKLEPVDGYILNAVAMSGAFEEYLHGKPSVYVAHNVEHRSAWENSEAATSVIQKTLFAREARLLEQIETRLCNSCDFVFTLSDEDRQTLKLDMSRSAVLPLVTRSSLPPKRRSDQIKHDCTLIGTWTWQPNRIGLEWFLDDVVPHLSRRLDIAIGGNASDDLKKRYPDVLWAGRVPDATEFVRSGAVVPLISRAGTGVQLKTIETFELGLPSVATRHSLRGMAIRPDNCVVADDAQQFADLLVDAVDKSRDGKADRDGRSFQNKQVQALDQEILQVLQIFRSEPLRQAV